MAHSTGDVLSNTLWPGPPLLMSRLSVVEGFHPVSPLRSDAKLLYRQAQDIFQRHSPSREMYLTEVGAAKLTAGSQMEVGESNVTFPMGMPVVQDLSVFGIFQGVIIGHDTDFPGASRPFKLNNPIVLKDGQKKVWIG